jgi:outer membrane protein assembly factor BamB
MGLRVAILLAVVGGLALAGGFAFFAVPKRRGPRAVVVATSAAILLVATLVVFLAPISGATPAPVGSNLSLYMTGQICENAPPTFNSSCGSGSQALLNLRATDGVTRWSAPANVSQSKANNAFSGAPILRDGVLYTLRGGATPGDPAATLLALRATNGSEIWRTALDSAPLALQVADGQVFVLLKDHEDFSLLRVFNARDGAAAQHFTLPIFSGLVITNGLVIGCDTYFNFAGPAKASLIAYHANDGSLAWRGSPPGFFQPPSSLVPCALALGDDVLYQAPMNGAVITALRVRDGQPLWTAQADSVAALGLSGDRLIAVSGLNAYSAKPGQPVPTTEKIIALNLADGRTLWQREFSAGPVNGPYSSGFIAGDDERAFVATTGALRALRLSDGATLWDHKNNPSNGQLYSYPVVAQKTIFAHFGYYSGFEPAPALRSPQPSRIFALNTDTGDPYWSVSVYSTGFALGEV